MLRSGDVLDLSPIGAKMFITSGPSENGGAALAMEIEMGPGSGGTPLHIHRTVVETYEVLEGTFDAYVGNGWKTYAVGDRFVVEAGVPHTFRNSSDATARVLHVHEPALRFEEYFERLHRLINSGVITSGKMTLPAMIRLSMLMTRYPEEITPVNPPVPVMRAMAFIGRLLGYRV